MGWNDDAIYKSMHESMYENGASKRIDQLATLKQLPFRLQAP